MKETISNAVWAALTVVISVGICFQFKSIFIFQREAERLGVKTNRVSDLNFMLVALLLITVIRWAASLLLSPKIDSRLLAIDPENFETKRYKNARSFIGFLWYVFATVS